MREMFIFTSEPIEKFHTAVSNRYRVIAIPISFFFLLDEPSVIVCKTFQLILVLVTVQSFQPLSASFSPHPRLFFNCS